MATAEAATGFSAPIAEPEMAQPPLPPSWAADTVPSRAITEPYIGEDTGPSALPPMTPFAHEPPFRPRRNPARRWTIIAIAVGAVLLAINAALLMLGGIDGISSRLIGQPVIAHAESPLQLAPTGPPERRRLDSGHEILTIAGRIDNPSDLTTVIPDIRAELLNAEGRTIYSWIIPAPAPRLQGGASIPFDGVTVDVPPQASRMRLSFVTAAVGR